MDDPQCVRAIAAGMPPKRILKDGAAVGKFPKQTSKCSNVVGKSPKLTSTYSDAVGKRPKQIANADEKSPKHTVTPKKKSKTR